MKLSTIIATLLTILGMLFAVSSSANIPNETAITFKANSGETADAFEGHLFVSENRNNPDSRKIRINYVRFPATGEKKGPPIVYLSGGPGGSGIGTAKWRRFPLFMALREFGDVIALDQRGTGQSEQAEYCVSSHQLPLTQLLKVNEVRESYQKAAMECIDKWQKQGVDVYGYTTEQNALDIDDLRAHLGAEKVILWGISYGSHLALSAMKLYPENIDKVIIASAEGLNQTVKLPAETDAYFTRIQSVIEQTGMGEDVPDLPALMKSVHAKLDESPMLVEFSIEGKQQQILFQKHYLQGLASMMIADPNQYLGMLIQLYSTLENNNTQVLEGILQRGVFKNDPIGFRLMSMAMDVASGITDERLAIVQKQAQNSLLGDKLNFPMPMLNNVDNALDLGDDFRQDPVSDIPTLLLTGTLDGRTYPSEQAEAVKGLSNLQHVIVENAGHNLYMSSPKVLERMQAFMRGENTNNQVIELPVPMLANR